MQLFIVFLLLRHKWFKTAKKPATYINNSFLNVFFKHMLFAIIIFVQKSFDEGLHEMTIFFALILRKSLFCAIFANETQWVVRGFAQFLFRRYLWFDLLNRANKSNLVCRRVFQKSSVNHAMKELSKIYAFLWTKLLRVIQFLHRVIKSFRYVEQSYQVS